MNLVVVDTTVLALIRSGRVSSFISQAHRPDTDRRVLVPSMCLAVGADRVLAEHVLMLPALEVVELTAPQAASCAALLEQGMDVRHAHAAVVGAPVAGVGGFPVLTAEPEAYAGTGVTAVRM